MKRTLFTCIAFGLCLAVVLAAMGWVSLTALRLEREQERARQRAALEEKVRLALWRMDSALTPLVARESARPYFVYTAFYPAERSYTRMFAEIRHGDVLLPSPLLTEKSQYVLLHFQIGPDGRVTSPQAPTGNMRDLAEARYASTRRIHDASHRLVTLTAILNRPEALALLPKAAQPRALPGSQLIEVLRVVAQRKGRVQQIARSNIELQARFENASVLNEYARRSRGQASKLTTTSRSAPILQPPAEMIEGVICPVWMDSALLLVRRVTVDGREYVQGCWLDWTAVRHWLLNRVRDLLPQADLVPVYPGKGTEQSRMLTALPVKLVPGEIPIRPTSRLSPLSISLIMAWVCVLVAAVAVAVLLLGALSLSERRGAFVSAVTHELRTPLTTFQMYTEMLAEKMVPEEKRRRYLGTLRIESDRLSHLVENVLSYAQLEKGRPKSRLERLTLRDILDRTAERLSNRAEQAGMQLVVEEQDDWADVHVRADATAAEQVLFNLVDNACKYAVTAEDKRLHIEARAVDGRAEIRVRDHGPGISRHETRKLFRPFRKSARDAANSAPGVGLGLALCRRLARGMGGTLRLDETVWDGACFVLSLPVN